jgi:plasmid replication initiation protein
MNELVLIDENSEIKKAEALIKSRYKLNELALKLITSLISAVQETDNPFQQYIFEIKNFADLSEVKGKSIYENLKEACYEIMSKPIYIGKKGSKDFKILNWATVCEYVDKEGVIKFEVSRHLKPYIVALKQKYLKYDLKNILKLKSSYSIKIYELLKNEYNLNARYNRNAVIILSVDELRDRLQIPDSYDFKSIRVQILDKAKSDLLKHTDIKFEWEIASKIRKKIHSIKFTIYPNLKNVKEDNKLPVFLENFMKYAKFLNENYAGTQKKFFVGNFVLTNSTKKETYFFGIDNKNLVYAIPVNGGNSINLTKDEATIIRNASYLCGLYSEVYRDIILHQDDIESIYENDKNYFGIITGAIKQILSEYDPRVKPLF